MLIIDNYDSFTYNIVEYVRILGKEPIVIKNDAISISEIEQLKFDKIIITPYGTPKEKFTDNKTINILFDDEKKNRENWEKKENNIAFDEKQLIKKIISIENNVA